MYFFRARFMDPRLGRFISQDPLGVVASGLNLQAYAGNNPVGYTDLLGLENSAPNSAGGLALGSRLRSVPLVGGMLGAFADIASGEVKYGVNSLSTILVADLKAKLVGVYGHEVAKKNAFDKFVADPTLENIKNLALTTMIPSYGNFGGRGWGVDQGRDLSKILNFVDFNSALHDQEYGNLEFPDANKSWVYRNYSSVPSDQIAPGPFGVTYVLEGTAPFLLFK